MELKKIKDKRKKVVQINAIESGEVVGEVSYHHIVVEEGRGDVALRLGNAALEEWGGFADDSLTPAGKRFLEAAEGAGYIRVEWNTDVVWVDEPDPKFRASGYWVPKEDVDEDGEWNTVFKAYEV